MADLGQFKNRLTQTTGRLTRVYRATKMMKTVYGGWSSVQRRTAWMQSLMQYMENTKRTLTIATQMLLITMLVMPPLLPPTTFCLLLKLLDFDQSIDNETKELLDDAVTNRRLITMITQRHKAANKNIFPKTYYDYQQHVNQCQRVLLIHHMIFQY